MHRHIDDFVTFTPECEYREI